MQKTEYSCWKCQSYLELVYNEPIILICPECDDRYIIPLDIIHNKEQVEAEIKTQYIMMEAFSKEGEEK